MALGRKRPWETASYWSYRWYVELKQVRGKKKAHDDIQVSVSLTH
jgi:hypothetical protein